MTFPFSSPEKDPWVEGERNQESNSGRGTLEMFSGHPIGNMKQTAGRKIREFIETQGRLCVKVLRLHWVSKPSDWMLLPV